MTENNENLAYKTIKYWGVLLPRISGSRGKITEAEMLGKSNGENSFGRGGGEDGSTVVNITKEGNLIKRFWVMANLPIDRSIDR